ncbi:hypothetical protein PF006_g13506 [Phytophthora fragariae]|uniref:Uncharacterized protein n=1 Tax=Phytophthora fragariae TaxID=53985 RepID=A0A6A3FL20_9STRA|nr:hypothetical protein PF009_g4511 [Phytophthora fragariae]KAE9140596.1 hypothetical protein PF006_g13506 [Phytophthora fragariae]
MIFMLRLVLGLALEKRAACHLLQAAYADGWIKANQLTEGNREAEHPSSPELDLEGRKDTAEVDVSVCEEERRGRLLQDQIQTVKKHILSKSRGRHRSVVMKVATTASKAKAHVNRTAPKNTAATVKNTSPVKSAAPVKNVSPVESGVPKTNAPSSGTWGGPIPAAVAQNRPGAIVISATAASIGAGRAGNSRGCSI